MRLAQGPGTGKALLFNNIKDYNTPASRCRRIFGSALNSYRRIAMMLGLPPDTHPRELVKIGRTILAGSVPPKIVKTGPAKENIITGDDIDLYEFPAPYWNRLDGGRYLMTYGGCVTKDPETGVMNVGVYRGMIADKTHIPILMWRAQHIGHHVTAWQNGGASEMPIAVAMGSRAGARIRRRRAGAERHLRVRRDGLDPRRAGRAGQVRDGRSLCPRHRRDRDRGLSADRSGDLSARRARSRNSPAISPAILRRSRPIRVTAITHRNDPILRGTIEGALPGSYSENAVTSSIMRAATAWNVLDRAGVPGITDVWCPPVHAGVNLLIQMKQSYRNQAKQAANAIWGSSAAHVRYKHITVVDDDIDIHDYAAVDWAIAYRVNAGEDDIVIMPSTFGLGLDPSVRKRDRNPALFGTGKWNRVLIDATMNFDYDPDPDFGGARFPPKVWPEKSDIDKAYARWSELGLGKPKGG